MGRILGRANAKPAWETASGGSWNKSVQSLSHQLRQRWTDGQQCSCHWRHAAQVIFCGQAEESSQKRSQSATPRTRAMEGPQRSKRHYQSSCGQTPSTRQRPYFPTKSQCSQKSGATKSSQHYQATSTSQAYCHSSTIFSKEYSTQGGFQSISSRPYHQAHRTSQGRHK